MTPWLILPSANPSKAIDTLPSWKKQGWAIAVLLDHGTIDIEPYFICDKVMYANPYRGYPAAIQQLIEGLPDVQCFLAAGDDMFAPDNIMAGELADLFFERFPDGCGVLQCTGDPWAPDAYGTPAAARICGSPMFGREYARRANQGRGVFWPEYWHFFADEEMKNVTERQGILMQAPRFQIYHDHWHRDKRRRRPGHMAVARDSWAKDKATFETRKAAGFPGSELLPIG